MKKIASLCFRMLPLSAHLQFFYQTDARLAAAGDDLKKAIAPLLPPFHAMLTKEHASYQWIRKSKLTQQITNANEALDSAIVRINAGINFCSRSLTPAVAASGVKVHDMLKNYGNITLKSYDAKMGAVHEALEHMDTDYAQDIFNLGLSVQQEQLQTALDTFVNLLNRRSNERVNKPSYTATMARKELESAWQSIVYVINSNAGAGTSADFATFIDHLNPEIKRINAEFHRVLKDLGEGDHTVITPIPIQQYNKEFITPLPEVYYAENEKPDVKLYLGKDFSITYKNNKDAGMAELTIHGKGDYKGKKSTTFHIAGGSMRYE